MQHDAVGGRREDRTLPLFDEFAELLLFVVKRIACLVDFNLPPLGRGGEVSHRLLVRHLGECEGVFLIGDGIWNSLHDRTLAGNFHALEAELGALDGLLGPLENNLLRLLGEVVFLVHLLELLKLFRGVFQGGAGVDDVKLR